MAKRATITDLAREAGVSVATVDRVLNQRHPVREDTAARVVAAAERVGYHATALLRRRLQHDLPPRTLGFLLQKHADHFYQTLGAELIAATQAARDIRGRALVEFMDELTPATIATKLREIGPRVDAVAVVAVDHPHVSEAVAALHARGKPVFTLLSDLTAEARAGYVGLDSRKAGRSAAWMIARTASQHGAVGTLVGSHRYLGQELAEISFRSYFREHAPEFHLLETLVNLEDPRIAYEATLELLKRRPDLVGLYVAGGGMDGVIEALRDEASFGRVTLVCNELTPTTRAGLIDGVVTLAIATPLPLLAARAVEAMVKAIGAASSGPPAQVLLPFSLFIAENI
jgi:LacI family transcriptional regulator